MTQNTKQFTFKLKRIKLDHVSKLNQIKSSMSQIKFFHLHIKSQVA